MNPKAPCISTPQLPFKEPQILSNRNHQANRGTLGGLGSWYGIYMRLEIGSKYPIFEDSGPNHEEYMAFGTTDLKILGTQTLWDNFQV